MGELKVSGTFFIHCPSLAIVKSVGLICQRRKVHGALATDCLLLRKLPETQGILPIAPVSVTRFFPQNVRLVPAALTES